MVVLVYDANKEKFVSDEVKCEKCGEYYSPFMEGFSNLKHKCKPMRKRVLSTASTGRF